MTKIKVYHGWVYEARFFKHPIQRLASFASLNSLNAVDIVSRARRFYENGSAYDELWAEAMETAGMDPMDFSLDDAEQADTYNRTKIRSIQEQLSKRNRRLTGVLDSEVNPDLISSSGLKRPNRSTKTIWGFPLTSVIRWMGKEGWNFDRAFSVLKSLDRLVPEATVRSALSQGKTGKRGKPADLSKKQIQELNHFSDN